MTYRRLGAIMASALLLVGCSSNSDDPEATDTSSSAAPTPKAPTMGLPKGVDNNASATAGAGLSPDGKLWVVTYGSSTNPLAVTDVSASGQTVAVELAQADRPATMDLVPSTSTLDLPDGVDPKQPITVVLGKLGSLDLGMAAPGYVTWLPAQ